MTAADRAIVAARAVVGARFRLHGRDPATGLDCVGVVALALAAADVGIAAPSGYGLRGGETLLALLDAALGRVATPDRGDVAAFMAGPAQIHLGIWTGEALIHADAGLRRVVERPGWPAWRMLCAWRIGEG